jgi:mutator protein MutT
MPKDRHKAVPASYLMLLKDGKVLLARRQNTEYMNGKYALPAGHVEAGETFTQCIIRESKEEIGVDLASENLKMAHMTYRISEPEWNDLRYRIDVFFVCEKWGGEIKNMEPDKCDDIAWFDLDKLPENIVPYVRQAIENIRDKKFYSEFGWDVKY